MKNFKTKYGYFAKDGKEFVITDYKTPRPWTNILTNGDYGAIVSQTGSGYSWKSNAQLNRITRWEQDLVKDEWGKYLYIRDDATEKIWSAGWKPVCADPDFYEARHGIGYTEIVSRNHGIESDMLMFIANDDPVELWKVRLTNTTKKERILSLYSYFEWNLGAAPDWHREFHKCFINTEYDPATGTIYGTKRLWEVPSPNGHWNRKWEYVAFHACSVRPSSFDCDKESFLGMYENQRAPKSVIAGKLKKQSGNSLDAIGSLQIRVKLKPNEGRDIVFILGAVENKAAAKALVQKYRTVKKADETFGLMQAKWNGLLGTMEVQTPDDSMNLMLNTWLKYQAIAGRLWGRTGYYQTGGAYGFRDQLQDSQIFLPIDASKTKEQILLHARHQFKDGQVYHWWHPLSEIGLPTEMTDDLLWLPYLAAKYLEETDDDAVMDSVEPFIDDKEGATLNEHCIRAVEKVFTRMSVRGLPLIGAGDWNDGLSAVGLEWKGESIWLGQFLHRTLLDLIPILERRGDSDRAQLYRTRASQLRKAINSIGWDGEYYWGATKDSGEKLGSSANTEGKVWLNSQTWSVIGDIADEQRAHQVMDVVETHLEFKAGTLLVSPAYKKPDPQIGYLTRYASGMRENGGTYTHAATWSIIAHAKMKRAASAYRSFMKINPIIRGRKPDEYVAEPYITPGNIDGPASRFYGRGGWTWYTGSAAWLFIAGTEWILGVRATGAGLMIDPCIPKEWSGYSVKRVFRGATYHIAVKNPLRVSHTIQSIRVDGQAVPVVDGKCILPLYDKDTEHSVEVILGN
ncbi:MAG: glycosyl transferase family 36 [Ignavibacteriales bacterium]|nr:glycosyl transferase family 36 [Ignavibacteriales bacterium]